MFQIMTEEEIKRADEITLRERVRALMKVKAVFEQMRDAQRETVDMQRRCLGVLIEITNMFHSSRATLGLIEMRVRKRPRKKPKKHSHRLSSRGR